MFISAQTWPEHKPSVHNTAAEKLDLNIKHKKTICGLQKSTSPTFIPAIVLDCSFTQRYYKHVLSLHQGNSNIHLREIPRPPGKVTELSTIWILISAVTTFCGKCLLRAGSLRSKLQIDIPVWKRSRSLRSLTSWLLSAWPQAAALQELHRVT